ncbi:MAG TPA: DUF1634 domain-containing protein [Candidatus Limnocylindrales bacterium]|nr:DUF1634 domain-containing protein [Candidatus Limnocylindrales bacterium]
MTGDAPTRPQADLDRSIARLLTVGTYGSVALLGVGVVLMLAAGIAPLAGGPRFELGLLVDDLVHLRPAGFLWLGIVAVIATPSARVLASLIGYARNRERRMAIVAALILAIIALSVVLGLGAEA